MHCCYTIIQIVTEQFIVHIYILNFVKNFSKIPGAKYFHLPLVYHVCLIYGDAAHIFLICVFPQHPSAGGSCQQGLRMGINQAELSSGNPV